jgi:hypothetical protein
LEREGELAMATGSLTTRWSYPEAEVAKLRPSTLSW